MVTAETATMGRTSTKSIGHFELIEQVGVGHFGGVWKARDTELDRIVAVKIPRKGQLDPGETEQFLREARAAAQIRHPNIVSVHEVGRDRDSVYIVSDFVEGASLSEWLTGQQVTPTEAAKLCVTIAEALHAAHESGVIHRDLKPANIMLDAHNEPYITDFGLAKRETGEITMTVEGRILGTPAYMSPEQARGEGHKADRRSDVYSLGVVLFQLLTGELPFRGETRMLIVQILRDEPPPLRKFNLRIPRDLETITLKCLEKDPARRYSTARALAEDLNSYLDGSTIRARPIGRAQRGWRWCKRNPVVAGLTLALVVTLFTGLLGVTSQWLRAADAAQQARQAERKTRHALYVSDINLAQAACDSGDMGRAAELLDRHYPREGEQDLREFAWRHWWRVSHRYYMRLDAGAACRSVAFSPDGTIVGAGCLHKIILWDTRTGKVRATLDRLPDQPGSLQFSPDGKVFTTVGANNSVVLWSLATFKPATSFLGHNGAINCVRFSPDSITLASCSDDRTIKLWDINTGDLNATLKGHEKAVMGVAFSPDGKKLASVEDHVVKLWRIADARELASFETAGAPIAAFCPDGKSLITGDITGEIRLWDAETCRHRGWFQGKHAGHVSSLEFSPDGKTLLTSGMDRSVRIWDMETRSMRDSLGGHTSIVYGATYSADGMTIATAGDDQIVRLWKATPDDSQYMVRPAGSAGAIAWAPNGRSFVSACAQLERCDLTTRALVGMIKPADTRNSFYSVVFDPSGQTVITGRKDGTIDLLDASTSKLRAVLEGHSERVIALAMSPDGTTLASGSWDTEVRLWSLPSGSSRRVLQAREVRNPLCVSVAFCPSGTQLLYGDGEGNLKLWDVASGNLVWHSKVRSIQGVAVSPDGKQFALALTDGDLLLIAADTGRQVIALKGHTAPALAVAFSPTCRTLASSSYDGTVRLWDSTTGDLLSTLTGLKYFVSHVAFSPDGNTLAASGGEGQIKVWQATAEDTIMASSK